MSHVVNVVTMSKSSSCIIKPDFVLVLTIALFTGVRSVGEREGGPGKENDFDGEATDFLEGGVAVIDKDCVLARLPSGDEKLGNARFDEAGTLFGTSVACDDDEELPGLAEVGTLGALDEVVALGDGETTPSQVSSHMTCPTTGGGTKQMTLLNHETANRTPSKHDTPKLTNRGRHTGTREMTFRLEH